MDVVSAAPLTTVAFPFFHASQGTARSAVLLSPLSIARSLPPPRVAVTNSAASLAPRPSLSGVGRTPSQLVRQQTLAPYIFLSYQREDCSLVESHSPKFTVASSGVANTHLGGGLLLTSVPLVGIGSRPTSPPFPFSGLITAPLATVVFATTEMVLTSRGII